MKKLILSLLIIISVTQLTAQDKIYKLKGTVINAKVIEIGTEEIKYKLFESPDGPIYVVDKSSLNRIEFADGRVEKFKSSFKDPENYEGQLNRAVKLNFFAPLLGYSQFSFEKSLSPLKSYELTVGIIGAGKNYQIDDYYFNGQYLPYKRNAFGGFIEAGYKFNKLPNFFNKGARMTHIMQGSYVKPTVTLGFYGDNAVNYKTGNPLLEKRSNVFGAIILNFGQQWVFGDRFLMDIYYGVGYAFDNVKRDYNYNGYYYSAEVSNHFVIQKTGTGASLGLSGGLKAGILLNKPKVNK
ncbi:MAG: hypothetical protein ABIN97_13990 [Ginsengibacter sp.]